MKKISIILLLLSVLIINCKKEVTQRQGFVNFFIGDVFLLENNNKRTINNGDIIKSGTRITTGANGTVEIFIGGHMIKILKNSSVLFKDLSFSTNNSGEQSIFELEKGKMFSRITQKLSKESKFTIKTPTTVASVRGTDFTVSEEEKKSIVACLNGKIEVLNRSLSENNTVMLNGGEEVAVEGNKPLAIREITENNKDHMKNIINNFKQMRKEIREQFIKERDRYRKDVSDQKKKDQEMLQDEKQKNKENIDAIKDKTKDDIDKAKDTSDIKKITDDSSVENQKKKAKNLLDDVKPDMDVKPKIKK